eukprot:354834-Prymnesium_polylepis.1
MGGGDGKAAGAAPTPAPSSASAEAHALPRLSESARARTSRRPGRAPGCGAGLSALRASKLVGHVMKPFRSIVSTPKMILIVGHLSLFLGT